VTCDFTAQRYAALLTGSRRAEDRLRTARTASISTTRVKTARAGGR
jgi:hypothetical protein